MVFLFKCLCFLFYCSSLLLFSSLDANAFLYFLPDYEPKELIRSAEYCTNNGFNHNLKSCPAPRILKERCPVGNYYKTCYCAGSPTCTGSLSSANPYSNTTGTSRSSCVDCPGNTRYTWTCTRKCAASVSSKPSNSSYTTCSDCSGTYNTGWTCNSGYYKSGSSCVCATTCSDTVTSKPSNSSYTTTSCTACGVTTTIKTGWSCNSGYHKSGSACEKDCTPLSSQTGCSCGTYSCSNGCGGTRKCCKVCDPEDRDCQCPGYVYCGTTKTGSGGSCTAGSKTFYKTCLVEETCFAGDISGVGMVGTTGKENSNGYGNLVREYCTTQKGVTMYLYTYCIGSIEGVKGPCDGKVACPSGNGYDYAGSTPCTCAPEYLDVCEETCKFEGANNPNGAGYCSVYGGTGWYYIRDKCKHRQEAL